MLIPIFGFKIGFASLFLYDINTLTIISSVLYIVSAFLMFFFAYKMTCKGDYYEDGIKFAAKQAKLIEKQGKLSVSEMFGRKRKFHKFESNLKGNYASVIFSKQWVERRRTNRFILGFSDLLMFAISIFVGIIVIEPRGNFTLYFIVISGLAIYLSIFFSTANTWLSEFNHYNIYVIPATNRQKLFYATLMESINLIIKSILLIVPAAIISDMTIGVVIVTFLAQIAIRIMILYKSLFVEGFVMHRLGNAVGSLIGILLSFLLLLIPIICLAIAAFAPVWVPAMVIVLYCSVVGSIFMYFNASIFTNTENIIKAD